MRETGLLSLDGSMLLGRPMPEGVARGAAVPVGLTSFIGELGRASWD